MRRAVFHMSADFLNWAFIEKKDFHILVESGLPEDAKFIACHYDNLIPGRFNLVYESEEFEDIAEAEKLPVYEIVMKTIECSLEDRK